MTSCISLDNPSISSVSYFKPEGNCRKQYVHLVKCQLGSTSSTNAITRHIFIAAFFVVKHNSVHDTIVLPLSCITKITEQTYFKPLDLFWQSIL